MRLLAIEYLKASISVRTLYTEGSTISLTCLEICAFLHAMIELRNTMHEKNSAGLVIREARPARLNI